MLQSQAQDILLSTNGSKDTVTITEITPELIKFRKAEHPGISYSKLKKEISAIQYADGKKEFVSGDTNKQLNASAHITDKGNKVFLEVDNSVEQLTGKYLAENITVWGYWKLASDLKDADFILNLKLTKKRGAVKGFFVLKSKDGLEILHSKSVNGKGHPGDDYHGVALNIVEYLKKLYW